MNVKYYFFIICLFSQLVFAENTELTQRSDVNEKSSYNLDDSFDDDFEESSRCDDSLSYNSSSSISVYQLLINQAFSYPMLTREEQFHLYDKKNKSVREKYVNAHLRTLPKIINRYKGYGLPPEDLFQEGVVGLIKAYNSYDPSKGFTFMTHAIPFVRGEINEYIVKNWQIVKAATTKPNRKIFFHKSLLTPNLTMAKAQQIANELDVPIDSVLYMNQALSGGSVSFHSTDSQDENSNMAPEQWLGDHRFNPIQQLIDEEYVDRIKQIVHEELSDYGDREQDIMTSRWLSEEKSLCKNLEKNTE